MSERRSSEAPSDTAAAAGADGRGQASVEASGLTKIYGRRTVVDSLSFSVYPGELYALLGDNGAGKTTTINMLTTLLSPNAGSFSICGYNGATEAERCKAFFGVVSQDVALYQELTAYENLRFVADLYGMPRTQAQRRIAELLDEAGLSTRANDLAGEFSMGMQRKLSIALAILHDPQVLFMDEPTVGLDPQSRLHIWQNLKELKRRGVTILLTTHYLEEAELLADRIGIIRHGRLVVEGTIGQLREKIRGIRSISITLADHAGDEDLEEPVRRFLNCYPTEVIRDPLRNTLSFAQPSGVNMTEYLEAVLSWLKAEGIPFSKFATREPSLEEVFLSVAARDRDGALLPGGEDRGDTAGGGG